MSQDASPSAPPHPVGNIGVPVGCVLILVCFFLPWITLTGVSGLQMSSQSEKAEAAFGYLGARSRSGSGPILVTRGLYIIPLLALSTLLLELAVPPAPMNRGRFFARLGILGAGAALSLFFIYFGCVYGLQLSYGFWGSLTGALFITVGVIFNVARGE